MEEERNYVPPKLKFWHIIPFAGLFIAIMVLATQCVSEWMK